MANARSQSFDNLLTITSINNSELASAGPWKPRTATDSSVESLESGYDTVDGNTPAKKVDVKVLDGKNFPAKKKKDIKTVCEDLFKDNCAIKIFVIILFFLIVVGIPLIWHFYKAKELRLEIGRKIRFLEKERILKVTRNDSRLLRGQLGQNIPQSLLPHDCARGDENKICLQWFGEASLIIKYIEYGGVLCYDVEWTAEHEGTELKDCYSFAGSHWYGGPLLRDQTWPLDVGTYDSTPYVSGSHWDEDLFGSVIERHWVSSKGVGVSVSNKNPLFISSNSSSETLCLHSHYYNSPYRNEFHVRPVLNYSVCSASNSTEMTQFFITNRTPIPQVLPDVELMRLPSWSPPVDNVNETQLLKLAKTIKLNSLPGKALELDIYKHWQAHEGDFDFDPVKFPNGANFTKTLKSEGFDLCLGVHPFANVDSNAFREGVKSNYFVMDSSGDVPGFSKWWGGLGTVLDTTNTKAVSWFVDRLSQMQRDYGVKRFLFYGGQTSWLPHQPTFSKNFSNPDMYAKSFVTMATKFGNQSQVQVGAQTQNASVFVRLEDHMSNWEAFRSIIPSILTLSVHGYGFVNPGVIGGYDDSGTLPDKELYIRWLQLSAFLPIMQFSVPPWRYGRDVVSIAQKFTKLHQEYVFPKMTRLAYHGLSTGDPIIRPLWWIDPWEFRVLELDSQFLIGDDVLVAPVLEKGATTRDVVLPFGVWKHIGTGVKYRGPQTINNFKVTLNEVAYFEKL